MPTILYVHGYGSTGNATKGMLLREMLPDCQVVSPTLDYDGLSPQQILQQLREVIENNDVKMIVGSSFGGYYSLCCATFFCGPIWLINPVHHVEETLRRVVLSQQWASGNPELEALMEMRIKEYLSFDKEVFQAIPQREGQLHFALSTDDELLGDHSDLMVMFPQFAKVVWKEDCGHRFMRFTELHDMIAETVQNL